MTSSQMSSKCSFKGSGLCGNCPFGSQYSLTVSQPNLSKSIGIAIPPVEFTASKTILYFLALIASASTIGKARIC